MVAVAAVVFIGGPVEGKGIISKVVKFTEKKNDNLEALNTKH